MVMGEIILVLRAGDWSPSPGKRIGGNPSPAAPSVWRGAPVEPIAGQPNHGGNREKADQQDAGNA
jgi:hypothetical protein